MKQHLKKMWAIFTPAERRKSVGMLVLALMMAVAETVGVISIMPFLSVLARPGVIEENPWLHVLYTNFGFTEVRHFIIALGLASITLVVCSSVFKVITQHLLNRFIHFLRHSLGCRLLSRYLHQPYEFFLTRNSAELSKNVLSEVDQLQGNLIQPLAQMIVQSLVICAMVLLIFLYDPLMAIAVLLAVSVLYGVIYLLVRRRLLHIGTERATANRERYQACNEALVGIKDVKVTHSAAAYTDRFKQASRQYARHLATNDTLSQTPLFLVEAVGYTGLIIIALVLLTRSNDVAHVLPALGLYGFAAYRMLPAAQIVYRGFAKLRFSAPALEAIHRDLQLPQETWSPPTQMLVPKREIRLSDVSYAYPENPDKPVLRNFDLVIPANTTVGIVGRSGAGKSTLMDILLGLLSPQGGVVHIDDTPLGPDNLAQWQHAIGYVPQHIFLADASVAENIAFGIPQGQIEMQAVERAARAAHIHDFVVNELPQGYDTPVGERGIRLSGGQCQRIGIARALYGDPPVLLMDEATSALDMETENAIVEAVNALSGSKTVLVVTHRESSLRLCSHIHRITDGAYEYCLSGR